MPNTGELRWRAATVADTPEIDRIARIIHPDLPEHIDTFSEKIALSPDTCFVADENGGIRGYAIAYPWLANDIPKLNTMLGSLPADASVLFIHDVALLPSVRGRGLLGELANLFRTAGRKLGFTAMTLAAVYGSEEAWFRYGFYRAPMNEKLTEQVEGYGTAVYMISPFDPK